MHKTKDLKSFGHPLSLEEEEVMMFPALKSFISPSLILSNNLIAADRFPVTRKESYATGVNDLPPAPEKEVNIIGKGREGLARSGAND